MAQGQTGQSIYGKERRGYFVINIILYLCHVSATLRNDSKWSQVKDIWRKKNKEAGYRPPFLSSVSFSEDGSILHKAVV